MSQFLIIFAVSQLVALWSSQSSSSVYGTNIRQIQKGLDDIESTISELVKNKDALKKRCLGSQIEYVDNVVLFSRA